MVLVELAVAISRAFGIYASAAKVLPIATVSKELEILEQHRDLKACRACSKPINRVAADRLP